MSRFFQAREAALASGASLRARIAFAAGYPISRIRAALSSTRGRAVAVCAALALLLLGIAAGFWLREPVERAAYAAMLGSATGYVVVLDGVRHENGHLVFAGLHAHSRGGAFVLDVDRIEVDSHGSHMALVVDGPHVALLPDRWRGDERESMRSSLTSLHLDGSLVDARVSNGTVVVATGAIPELAANFTGLEGIVHLNAGRLTYQLNGALADGKARYPIAGVADINDAGAVSGHWTASVLPLVPLSAAVPAGAPFRVLGGWLRDVTASYGAYPLFRVEAQLDDGDLELLAATHHELRGLHGEVALGEHSLGSTGLRATIDGLPFEFVGEVHDIRSRFRWVVEGSPDLHALGRLMFSIAAEPGLQSVHCEITAPGVLFAQYTIATDHGPLAVSTLLANPHEPTLHFDTAIADDHIVSEGERTSAMGVRTHAIGGVNGDYFDIGRTYQPQGLLIRSGKLLRGPTDRYALIVRRDGSVTFDEYHMRGTVQTSRGRFEVTQLNNWPAGHVTVITSDFGKVLPPAPGVTFVALDPAAKAGHYRVGAVTPANEPLPVTFGIAFGPLVKGPLPFLGEDIQLTYALDPAIGDAVAGIGGGPRLLKDGAWYDDAHAPAPDERDVRWPVIALATLPDDLLLLVAVDGRHPERSVGMTRPEFAELLQRFGASDAMALDSGGSVTLVSRAPGDENVSVRNQPSDNSAERWVSDALFLYSSAGANEIVVPHSVTTPLPEVRPSP